MPPGSESESTMLREVHDALSARAAEATDPRVTVGDRALLVECAHPEHGSLAGLAHRPAGSFDASDVETSVADLAGEAVSAPAGSVDRAVGIATLNALSTGIDWLVGDPMAALSADVDTVATVGLFRPAFRKFGDVAVRVVERDPGGVDRATLPSAVPTTLFSPEEAAAAFDGADVCFITGSTLVYGGIDDYLATAATVPLVVLVGATASFLPDPAFDRGVDLVAGARVLAPDRDRVRERVAAGDCGTDLHDVGVQKVYCSSSADLPGLQLPTERTNTQP
ncbi:Rossmann-like domain-containing protein [Salinigranum sp. GCM10025319]|uniref:Rossmann-like domain-containing protein n=1 Tax=Salinigranum sp. GCM10025319 TaxID=3252687 RepID=UPI00361BC8EC